MDIIRSRMNDATAKRFDEVWRLTTLFNPEDIAISRPMLCPTADAQQAVSNGIATRLPADTIVTCHAFSVLEHKTNPDRIRRRPIQWAKAFNARCKKLGYKADVDLYHHSRYFDRCNLEAGATFDLTAGFFQVPLPSSKLFTFKDTEGNIYGLNKLPMGISTAPELMQIITSTLAGSKTAVKPPLTSKAIVDVWIDNVLFSGTKARVREAVTMFKQVSASAGAAINWKESKENSSTLDFIGMSFDFENHTIGLSDKNRSKVKSMKFDRIMLMSDLETAAARLMYASSIMAVPLSSYYFALKFLRRKLSEVNRETLRRDENLNIPESVLRSLRSWQHDVLANTCRPIPREEGRTSYTLWTDASNLGWGAVLINNSTQQVRVVGARWTDEEAMLHINILEALAVKKALHSFHDLEGSVVQPRIDNTSVVATTAKGYSKSEDLNSQIRDIQAICSAKRILLKSPVFVRSKDNLADFWSRNFGD